MTGDASAGRAATPGGEREFVQAAGKLENDRTAISRMIRPLRIRLVRPAMSTVLRGWGLVASDESC